MSFNHMHQTYPHPSPTPGTAQAYLIPPMDMDADQPTVDTMPINDFTIFPVASIPPGIHLARSGLHAMNSNATTSKRVVIADAQSQLAIHAVRGLLKNADQDDSNDEGDESIQVYAMVQDLESPEAREIKALGATVLQYDPTSSSSIRSALGQSGSSTLLLIPPQVDDTVIRTSSILTEARHSIKSILMFSTIGTDHAMDLPPEDDIDPQQVGAIRRADPRTPSALLLLKEAEELVMHVEGGIEFVVLRAGFPLQHFFLLSALIQNRGSIPFTSETAHMAPISLADLGRAASILIHHTLASGSLPDDFKNKTVLLTGPEPLSGPMIVTAANERLPHPLTFAKVGISDMRSFLLQTHASRFELSLAMGWWRLFMDGKLDKATGDLSDILGGPERVTKIREFFEKHVDRFLPADGERFGGAKYVHDTYDEWDEVSSRGSSLAEGYSPPRKLVSMVVRDAAKQHDSPKLVDNKRSSIAVKCISDTHHTYFASARKPSMTTKVIGETRRSRSPSSAVIDPFVSHVAHIVAAFHADLARSMQATTEQLLALHASMPLEVASAQGSAKVQALIDRLGFVKEVVDACARDARKVGEAAHVTPLVTGKEPRVGMVAKVVGDVQPAHGTVTICETCLKPTRLIRKVVGDTEQHVAMGATSVGAAAEQHQDEEEAVVSKVGAFAKVIHDVAGEQDAGKVEPTQQGSCVIQ